MLRLPELDKAQFRTDPALLKAIRARGLNPNDVAREAFEAEARRMLSDDWLSRLREVQKRMKPLNRPAADIVREMRAERDRQLDRVMRK